MSIQATALAKALALLKIAGVAHAVVIPDGDTIVTEGYELRAISKKPEFHPDGRKVRVCTVKRGVFYNVYYPMLKDLAVGSIATITVPDELDTERVRSAACGYCTTAWGKGTYISETIAHSHTITIARCA
jgi:hypothetical protein